jgi:hypothetical protein
MTIGEEQKGEKGSLGLWIIVCGLSLAFLAYGLIAFLAIGDKGPPGWDFGAIPDTPGKSSFSTAADQSVSPERVEEQHVAGRPSSSEMPAKERPR